jgi:hypothetical protein
MPEERKRDQPPPGHFVSDDLREQTARFLEELRKRIRREKAGPGPRLGPPPK